VSDHRYEVRAVDSSGDLWVFASSDLATVKYVATEFYADQYRDIELRERHETVHDPEGQQVRLNATQSDVPPASPSDTLHFFLESPWNDPR
jgi:hypothetical protein